MQQTVTAIERALPEASGPSPAGAGSAVPLVVDLDGSLIRTDLLAEMFFEYLGQAPLSALTLLACLKRGKAALKHALAESVDVNPGQLPYNNDVLQVIASARRTGRPVYLASAADARVVRCVADYVGLFDGWIASDGIVNLRGERKAARLVEKFGERGFDYVSNESADIPVWRHAARAIVVGMPASLTRGLRPDQCTEFIPTRPNRLQAYFRLLRPHQWLKTYWSWCPS